MQAVTPTMMLPPSTAPLRDIALLACILRRIQVRTRAANDPSVFTITEKAPTRAFSWLKVPTSAFTFKTLC